MLVFWEQRLVFLATPKAGSTAIEAALESLSVVAINRPPALKHTSVTTYHRYVRPYLESVSGGPFTVVALMREPRDWLGSWYRFGQKTDQADGPRSTIGIQFEDFVQGWCAPVPPRYADFGTQSDFLLPDTGGKGVDHLFRYRDIDHFVDFLEERLHCEIILPHINVSPAASLQLSDQTEAMMRQRAAQDAALYAGIAQS
jgi:hypothetical protein